MKKYGGDIMEIKEKSKKMKQRKISKQTKFK